MLTTRHSVSSHFSRFLITGGISTAIHYILLIALVELFSVIALLASAFGYLISGLANYFINYFFTFDSNEKHRIALSRFSLIMAIGLCLNTLLFKSAIDYLGFHYLLAQLSATIVVLIFNFTASRVWTFKGNIHEQ